MKERLPSEALMAAVFKRVVAQGAFGGAMVAIHARLVGPVDPDVPRWATELSTLTLYVVLLGVLIPIAWFRARRRFAPSLAWLDEDREPTDAERHQLLNLPLQMVRWSLRYWAALAVITGLAGFLSREAPIRAAIQNAAAVVYLAIITSALAYLVAERQGQPILARALAGRAPESGVDLGPSTRLRVAWALGTGLPLVAIALTPLLRSPTAGFSGDVPVVFTAVVALAVSAVLMRDVGLTIVRPLEAVRVGMAKVAAGDLDASVVVDDGGELGQLQAGFNTMVAGLREREQIADLFGRQVGESVARQALERGAVLGGEQREVSVLFVDLTGSTALAQERPPSEVVAILNRFFSAVVTTADADGGWVNKFEGDGAMCVFGAPEAIPDHATRALRAARTLATQLSALGVEAGIGVSSGQVVAGNVGDERRFEYTVIGVPVNRASRLVEQAKMTGVVALADRDTVDAADDHERTQWISDGTADLRGIGPVDVLRPTLRPSA